MDQIFGIEDPFLSPIVDRINICINMANTEGPIDIADYFENMLALSDIVEIVPRLLQAGIIFDKQEYQKIGKFLSPLIVSLGARVNDYSEDEIRNYEESIIYKHLEGLGYSKESSDKEVNAILREGKYLKGEIPDVTVSAARNAWNKLRK